MKENNKELQLNESTSVEQLFYQCFDTEDYAIKDILGYQKSTQYVVVDKVQGHELTFDITENFDIYHCVASGIFFANKYSVRNWLKFLELCDQLHKDIVARLMENDNE